MTTPRTLRLHESDNVVVAVDACRAGTVLPFGLTATERVPKGTSWPPPASPRAAGAEVRPDHRLRRP
jgi:altronate hydrolase